MFFGYQMFQIQLSEHALYQIKAARFVSRTESHDSIPKSLTQIAFWIFLDYPKAA